MVTRGAKRYLFCQGTLEDEFGVYPPGTWIRNPIESMHQPFTKDGCTFFLKTGCAT